MKKREQYTCPLELTHDITKGKWKPIILWQLGKSSHSLSELKIIIEGDFESLLFPKIALTTEIKNYIQIRRLHSMLRDAEKTIGNLIDKQNISFIASISDDGFPNMKAMLPPRKRIGIKEFYFTTNTSSMRVAQYRKNPNASIYFYDKRFFRGIMLIGTMEVLEDNDSKQMIWQDGDTMYYPKGVTDPDYCVLHFTAYTGRYYANFHSDSIEIL